MKTLFLTALVATPLLALQAEDCNSGGDDTPTPTPTYTLSASVTASYDTEGIPHISGRTITDLAFGQGYVTARDRLWQMDFRRREGHGRLSELFGESAYSQDVSVRALGFTLHAKAALEAIRTDDPVAYDTLVAYASGVNAYLEAAIEGRDGESLPPQILALGYVPEPWTPVDSMVIDKALQYGASSGISDELSVWILSVLFGETLTADMLRPQPSELSFILKDFYSGVPTLPAPTLTAAQKHGQQPLPRLSRAELLKALKAVQAGRTQPMMSGSNNWVVSGQLTANGFPLLANDTHQGVAHPATYYEAHLSNAEVGGDVNMVGYGYAGMPFFLFGHNDTVAIGFTRNFLDVADLYLETVVGDSVLFNGSPVRMEVREESICVKPEGGTPADCVPRTLQVRTVPHHGPILPPEATGGLPLNISVKAAVLGPSSITSLTVRTIRARSFEDVQDALSYLVAGSQNVVYADILGNIGYTSRAHAPIREQIDPLRPPYMVMPGTGGYEWTGERVPEDLLPWAYNPARGFVASANNDPAGLLADNDVANGPWLEATGQPIYLSAIYDLGFRHKRIEERIEAEAATRTITPQDMMDWQADTVSLLARRTLPYLFDALQRRPDLVPPSVADTVEALETFRTAAYACDRDSRGALVFHAWYPRFFGRMIGDETDPSFYADMDDTYTQIFARPVLHFLDATAAIIDGIDAGTTPFPSATGLNYFDDQTTTDRVETRDELLIAALVDTVNMLSAQEASTGPRGWGEVHQILFNDPASRGGYSGADLGPYELDGGMFTVDVADSKLYDNGEMLTQMDVGGAPSQRTVYELDPAGIKVWDILPGGQNERPGAAHYGDQAQRYVDNEVRTLPFYPAEIAAAEASRLLLPPGFPEAGSPDWE